MPNFSTIRLIVRRASQKNPQEGMGGRIDPPPRARVNHKTACSLEMSSSNIAIFYLHVGEPKLRNVKYNVN